jgi:two-component system sensor histidine kinase UhpB
MIKWLLQRPGGVTARLLTIAVLPAALMFLMVASALYATAIGDVQRDVAERGRLIANALAQSSPYALVSGNLSYVHSTMRQLVESDRSIVCIALLNEKGQTIASQCQPRQREEQTTFEAPVRIESLKEVDLFDPAPAQAPQALRTVGTVRVTMSATPIFEARRGPLGLAIIVVLGVAVMSCLLAWRLTLRLRRTMSAVLAALRALRKGQFDVALPVHEPDELGELQRAIVEMASALGVARQDLEQQVRTRTHELRVAIEQIRQSDAEKRRLLTHSNAVIESDRKRVAVEIHDHLGASLISVRLEASALAAKAESSGDEGMARAAQRIADTVQRLYTSTRDIVKSLRPEVIDTLGLAGAVEELVSSLDRVHPDCRFRVHVPTPLPHLCSELAMQAYRVIQESLTNIVKHARASMASVTLSLSDDAQSLCIEIKDNGVGFNTHTSTRDGLGLIGMRERVASVDGEICISSPTAQGTTITVTLPLQHKPT